MTNHLRETFAESADDLKKELDTWLLGLDVTEEEEKWQKNKSILVRNEKVMRIWSLEKVGHCQGEGGRKGSAQRERKRGIYRQGWAVINYDSW